MFTAYILSVTLSFSTFGPSKVEFSMPSIAHSSIEACIVEGEKTKLALNALNVSYVCRPLIASVNGYN